MTVTPIPSLESRLAATSPSPPLFPFPHTTTARRPYAPPARSTTDLATARPAFSIRASTMIPRWALALSSSALSAGVRIGSTATA